MSKIIQAIATSTPTVIGIVIGAVLTYGLGALSRRHQEKREDETRWYEARLRTYGDFQGGLIRASVLANYPTVDHDDFKRLLQEIGSSLGQISLVGSTEVNDAAKTLFHVIMHELRQLPGKAMDETTITGPRVAFELAARKDLGR